MSHTKLKVDKIATVNGYFYIHENTGVIPYYSGWEIDDDFLVETLSESTIEDVLWTITHEDVWGALAVTKVSWYYTTHFTFSKPLKNGSYELLPVVLVVLNKRDGFFVHIDNIIKIWDTIP